ncbi:MAG: hypothetical protein ACRCX8_05105 [Sarcina sp.]
MIGIILACIILILTLMIIGTTTLGLWPVTYISELIKISAIVGTLLYISMVFSMWIIENIIVKAIT